MSISNYIAFGFIGSILATIAIDFVSEGLRNVYI